MDTGFSNDFKEPEYPFLSENQALKPEIEVEPVLPSKGDSPLKFPAIFDVHKFLDEKGTTPDRARLNQLFGMLKEGTTDIQLIEKLRRLADNYRTEYLEYITETVPELGEAINTYSSATESHIDFTQEQINRLLSTFNAHISLPYIFGEIQSMFQNYIFTLEALKKTTDLESQLAEKESQIQKLETKLADKPLIENAYSALSEASIALIYSDLQRALEFFSRINLTDIKNKSEEEIKATKDSGIGRVLDLYKLIAARIEAAMGNPELTKQLKHGNKIAFENLSKTLSSRIEAIMTENYKRSLPFENADAIKDLARSFYNEWKAEVYQNTTIPINSLPTELGRAMNVRPNNAPRFRYNYTSHHHAYVYLDESGKKAPTIRNISESQPIYIFTPGTTQPEILKQKKDKESTEETRELKNNQIIVLGGIDQTSQPESLSYFVQQTYTSRRLVYIPPTHLEKLKSLTPSEFELFLELVGNII